MTVDWSDMIPILVAVRQPVYSITEGTERMPVVSEEEVMTKTSRTRNA